MVCDWLYNNIFKGPNHAQIDSHSVTFSCDKMPGHQWVLTVSQTIHPRLVYLYDSRILLWAIPVPKKLRTLNRMMKQFIKILHS